MPLIVITGIPASGKTKTANELKTYFENKGKKVDIISENEIIKGMNSNRNVIYEDSKKEKELRSKIKSDFIRNINQEEVTIIDGLNYIKGYRYELYCASKSSKTTQCTIHCDVNQSMAWEFNLSRDTDDRYSKEIFDALVLRYEAPESRNRWDSPLFLVFADTKIDCEKVNEALFSRAPPAPNQSTQCLPLSETNFLYDMDLIAQEVMSSILEAKKMNLEGEVKVPGTNEKFLLKSEARINNSELTRLKRQFLSYVKLHPTKYNKNNAAGLFVQYLNTNF